MLATEVIKNKRSGTPLSENEIQFFIEGYTAGRIPDYQMASLLMAIFLNGMNEQETIHLTQCMLDSGSRVPFKNMKPIDKHSTGGVGDKTSLILAPIVAACGVPVPMMSGRGLGHTGGTLDKLESIPGFQVHLSLEDFQTQVEEQFLSFIGQTDTICPADKKIYALRDVTSTVESLPLICASIMSKKIAEGIKGLVLDVKVGSGAFMKDIESARQLARSLMSIGQGHGLETKALISDMSQPLGRFVGNSVEVGECLAILKRESFLGHDYSTFEDTESLSIELATHMVSMGLSCTEPEARKKVLEVLNNGAAFEKFAEVCHRQGGQLESLPVPTEKLEIKTPASGVLTSMNSEKVGLAGICLKAGRRLVTDPINPITGIEICKKVGDPLSAGDTLFYLHLDKDQEGVEEATALLEACYELGNTANQQPLILEKLSL